MAVMTQKQVDKRFLRSDGKLKPFSELVTDKYFLDKFFEPGTQEWIEQLDTLLYMDTQIDNKYFGSDDWARDVIVQCFTLMELFHSKHDSIFETAQYITVDDYGNIYLWEEMPKYKSGCWHVTTGKYRHFDTVVIPYKLCKNTSNQIFLMSELFTNEQ